MTTTADGKRKIEILLITFQQATIFYIYVATSRKHLIASRLFPKCANHALTTFSKCVNHTQTCSENLKGGIATLKPIRCLP